MKDQGVVLRGRRWVRRLGRAILWSAATIILLLGALSGAVYVYQDEIKAAILGRLNQHLQAEVQVDPKNIDVTVLSSFPDCALRFRNVLMFEALKKEKRDTLLFARQISLRFNVMDIWRGSYEIKRVEVTDGIVRPAVSKEGTENYVFWKAGNAQTSDSTRFQLDDVLLKAVRIDFSNQHEGLNVVADIDHLRLNGNFSSQNYKLTGKTEIHVNSITHQGMVYLADKKLSFGTHMEVSGNIYRFSEARLQLNDLPFNLAGGFDLGKGGLTALDVTYDAPEMNIGSLLSLMPEKFRKRTEGYNSEGLLYLRGRVRQHSGEWTATGTFGASDAMVEYSSGLTRAENLSFKGSFEIGQSERLEIRDLRAQLAGGEISGAFRLTDFSDPRIITELSAKGDLAQLHTFFPIDTVEQVRGSYDIHLGVAGRISSIKSGSLAGETTLRMQCGLEDLYAKLKGDNAGFTIRKCVLKADNDRVSVSDLQVERGSSHVTINGELPGFIHYLLDRTRQPLVIRGTLDAATLKVEDFVQRGNTNNNASGEPLIPAGLHLEMKSAIGQLSFGKFNATSVKGLVEIRNQKLMVSDLSLETMQGKAKINALADNAQGNLRVSADAQLEKINISQLFAQMNNFGQTTLQESHIRGFATADINFSGVWSNELESDLNSVEALCDLDIDKGELIGFKPLKSLGKFVEIQELEDVKFSKLHSRIEIESRRITIPRTTIKNSAIDIDFWGSHSFDHTVDYHFQLLMSDLFAAKHKGFTNTEFGEVARDSENRRSVFVLMTGNLDDPKIRYDRQGLRLKVKNDIAAEKQNMKQILKEEFGMFKKTEAAPAAPPAQIFRLEEKPAAATPKKELVLKKKEEEDF